MSGGNVHVLDPTGGWRHGNAILAEPFKVERNRLPDLLLRFLRGAARCHAARKVRDVGGKVARCLFDDDGIAHDGYSREPGLFADAVERTRSQVVAKLARDGDPSRLGWMLVLAMAAVRDNEEPTITFQQADDIANLHADCDACRRTRDVTGAKFALRDLRPVEKGAMSGPMLTLHLA